jgi:N-acetylmuramoyl-L-alanine amidase
VSEIKSIVVHCSESSFGDVPIITGWHIDRDFDTIGYNFVIENGYPKSTRKHVASRDGRIVQGRAIDFNSSLDKKEKGAHAYGFNSSSIGICLIGIRHFTDKQYESLMHFYKMWKCIIPNIKMFGHNEISSYKTCPNFDVKEFKKTADRLIFSDPKLNWA